MARWDADWFRRLDQELINLAFLPALQASTVRRELGKDPVAFAVIYLEHHLKGGTGRLTFSEIHFEWAQLAEAWKEPADQPQQHRHAIIAPRSTGKTTWWFLILPLWAAANGHVRFAAAFADTTGQAETHLRTFKHELDTNGQLNADYPDLCTPARRPTGAQVADRQGMLHTKDGFVFAARGVDSASLGMKVGERRPDLLILDDVEPDEASYSAALAEKRLSTLVDAILPLNIHARVTLVGTVTMPGSITHQLVKAAAGTEVAKWITEEKFTAHHHRPIVLNDDGTERSAWPAKWPLSWLQERRHTREYAKNYDNDPMARDGVYWRREDFRYGTVQAATRVALFVDPAVTSKKTSDFTGLAVVAFSPTERKAEVRAAWAVRLTGSHLRDRVVQILGEHPAIRKVVVEVNQGGELWAEVFHHLPGVRVVTTHATVSKEVRFAEALEEYQRGRVLHADRLPILEEQMVGFPKAQYDDVADAGVAGVQFFLPPKRLARPKARERVEAYV